MVFVGTIYWGIVPKINIFSRCNPKKIAAEWRVGFH
jgi:hypothetical protein